VRLAILCSVLSLSAPALALCRFPDCSCPPSEFTALAVYRGDGQASLFETRWADGGVAVLDAGEPLEVSFGPGLQRGEPTLGAHLLVGGALIFEDGGRPLGVGVTAFAIDDAGTTITCNGVTVSTSVWRNALVQGSCATLAPEPPCNDTPRSCSTTGGFALAAAALLVVRRVFTRR